MAKGKYWGDERRYFAEFDRTDFDFDLGKEWRDERAKGQRRDLLNKSKRLGMEFLGSQPIASWEKGVIDAIDNERGAREENDIMPGVIQDGRFYRCSKFTPAGVVKATFADKESAIDYMNQLNAAYDRTCR